MSAAPAPNQVSAGPGQQFGSDSPLTRAPAPVRSGTDREDVPKGRRAPASVGGQVAELEPHWLETIDSATD
jgi:hypothetical protein